MTPLSTTLESILFVATKPLTAKRLAELSKAAPADVETALEELATRVNVPASGIHLLRHNNTIQFVSNPAASAVVTEFLKEEQAGELTRPALETLTIIAYRGPISKIQLDTIRGVNCALILRNLMIKGLIESKTHKDRLQTSYTVTADFLRHLGLTEIAHLPDYERLHAEETLNALLTSSVATMPVMTDAGTEAVATESPTPA